jgi:ATP-dependent Lhr-like helicase
MLSSRDVVEVLTQAVLPHPMLAARWRWNLTRALVLPRQRGGKRRPIHLQRMEADDLLAAVWPSLAACQENAPTGPVVVPDHVLVRQTVDDCLHEGLSVDGLAELWARVESGTIAVHTVESSEPSPLSHGILSGRPFTFLDGAPLEERRTRALSLRRGLGAPGPNGLPVPTAELDALDPEAVAVVLEQVRPRPRTPDELHDVLLSLVACRPVPEWAMFFATLVAEGRADTAGDCWVATE